ncbi:MAG: VOC family protein [Pseudomonadota bacterium]
MTQAPITRLILYTRRMEQMVRFFETHFGYTARRDTADRIVELIPNAGGLRLLLHPASKAAREGQVAVKIVFDVPNVSKSVAKAGKNGLEFGPVHAANGYCFANAKDPSKNSISVSSRAFVPRSG